MTGGDATAQSLTLLTSEATQREVIMFLSDPATHGGAPVERIDTHISRIFLAGDRAWKMKRAIRTNYLDFSSLDRRERMCHREIEVNRAAANIYIGTTPVVRREGRLRIGGQGEPVEWLVEMRRFDRSQELDRLCGSGGLTLAIVERLADEVATLHRAAPETPDFGDSEDLRQRIEQIAGAIEGAGGGGLAPEAKEWAAVAQATRQAQEELIERRRRLGRVRRCHGDLHLGNVVMLRDRPTPFDAIEFNEAIASIDVLYDLALTLSDLLMRSRPDLANGLINRYLSATRDYVGLALMPLYLSMRAGVRAMTAVSRGAREEAIHDLSFALASLGKLAPRRLIAIGGISGTGKSTLARVLAPRIAPLAGAVVIRSDVVRKRLSGVQPEIRLPLAAYSPRMDRRVLARIAYDARVALRAGAAVVLDATFIDSGARSLAVAVALAEGARFDGLWLELPAEEAIARVNNRTLDASDATAAVVSGQAERAICPADWRAIPVGRPLEAIAADVEGALAAVG